MWKPTDPENIADSQCPYRSVSSKSNGKIGVVPCIYTLSIYTLNVFLEIAKTHTYAYIHIHGCFPKMVASPNNHGGFPTKNWINTWGVKWGVNPPFKETQTYTQTHLWRFSCPQLVEGILLGGVSSWQRIGRIEKARRYGAIRPGWGRGGKGTGGCIVVEAEKNRDGLGPAFVCLFVCLFLKRRFGRNGIGMLLFFVRFGAEKFLFRATWGKQIQEMWWLITARAEGSPKMDPT